MASGYGKVSKGKKPAKRKKKRGVKCVDCTPKAHKKQSMGY